MSSVKRLVFFAFLITTTFFLIALNKHTPIHASNISAYESGEEFIVAQNSDVQPQDKPFLVFGFGADSPPISNGVQSIERGIDSDTFCGVLYDAIEERFSDEYQISRVPMYSGQRFQGFQQLKITDDITIDSEDTSKAFFSKNIGLECGPNSIRGFREEELKKYGGKFSEGFYTTGAKILINKEDRRLLYKQDFPLANSATGSKIIAVVGGIDRISGSTSCPLLTDATTNTKVGKTTTVDAINTIYGATIKEYAVRDEALDCLLTQGSSTLAYSTDHILLQGLLKEFQDNYDNLDEFVIEPKTHNLTYERYGVVVYGEADERLLSTVNGWIQDIGIDLMDKIDSKLSKFRYTLEGPGTWTYWRPIEVFYRDKLPLFFSSRGTVSTFILFVISLLSLGIMLTHRVIAKILSRLFPQPFRFIIDTRRYLREKGDKKNNSILKWLGSFGIGSEEVYALALKETQGYQPTNLGDIDDYVIANILMNQFRIVRYVERMANEEQKNPEDIKEAIVEKVSRQMKHNPHTQGIVSEWSKWISRGGNQFADNFGLTFGRELAVRLIELTVGQSKELP